MILCSVKSKILQNSVKITYNALKKHQSNTTSFLMAVKVHIK